MADMTSTETLKALFTHMLSLGYEADSDMCVRTEDGAEEWYSATSEYGKNTNAEEFFLRMVVNAPAKFQVIWYLPGTDAQEQRLEVVVPVYCTKAHTVTDTSWASCERQINSLITFWHYCSGEVITRWFKENNNGAYKSFMETASRARPLEYHDLWYMAALLNAMVGILLSNIANHEDIGKYPQCFNETLRVSRRLAALQGAVMPKVKGKLVNKHAVDYGWRD